MMTATGLSWRVSSTGSPFSARLTKAEKYKDVLDDEGIPLPPKEYPDEEYYRKVAEMWGEE